jgi:hypothetical protein
MSVVRIILILLRGLVIHQAALAAEDFALRQQKAIVAGLCEASRVRLTRVLTNLGIAASSWYRRSVPREHRRRPGPSPQPIDRDFPFSVPETTILLNFGPIPKSRRHSDNNARLEGQIRSIPPRRSAAAGVCPSPGAAPTIPRPGSPCSSPYRDTQPC